MVTSIRIMATVNQEAVFRAWLERKNKEYMVRKKTKFKLLHMYIYIFLHRRHGQWKKEKWREKGKPMKREWLKARLPTSLGLDQ